MLLSKNILTGDRLHKAITWYQKIKLRKEVFDNIREAYKVADENILSLIYEINDALKDCLVMACDDLAPYDVQGCKNKLHKIVFEDTELDVEGRPDRVSDLQNDFITFHKGRKDVEKLYIQYG